MQDVIYSTIADADYWVLYMMLQRGIPGYIIPKKASLYFNLIYDACANLYIAA